MSVESKLLTIAENEQKVYDAGKKAQYDEFWDEFQQKGNRADYYMAFAGLGHTCWNEKTFNPKYTFRPKQLQYMFYNPKLPDVYPVLERNGITIDVSGVLNATYGFQDAALTTRFPPLKFSNSINTYLGLFKGCVSLETIDYLYISDGKSLQDTFLNCHSLKNIEIGGVINYSDVNFQWSPLSLESMKSIITHLKDLTGSANEGKYKLTFSQDCWRVLDNDGMTSPNGNKWRDYVTDLGWVVG